MLSVILPCCTELDKGREARCYDSALALVYTVVWWGKLCKLLSKCAFFEEIVDEKSIKTGLSLRVFEIELAGNVTRTVTPQWLVDSKFRGLPETGMRRHLFFRIGMVFGI